MDTNLKATMINFVVASINLCTRRSEQLTSDLLKTTKCEIVSKFK